MGPSTALLSWSIAKSVLHAAVGLLVADGRLDPAAPAPVSAWSAPGDPRRAITLDDLLTMRDGLRWVEEYDPAAAGSDVITMLFGGTADMAAYAADRPLARPPGTAWAYSSGTTNIVSGLVADVVGRGDSYRRWLEEALLHRIGMTSSRLTFDDTGTWVASSFLYATARDWLRFGELYLRDGVWEGSRLLPEGWVDAGRRPYSPDPEDPGTFYGRHWWTEADRWGTWWASGYEGQTVTICPALDVVVVRFGRTPEGSTAVAEWRRSLLGRMAGEATPGPS